LHQCTSDRKSSRRSTRGKCWGTLTALETRGTINLSAREVSIATYKAEQAFLVRDRVVAIASDDAFVVGFLQRAYGRLGFRPYVSIEQPEDRGEIMLRGHSPRLLFNGKELAWPMEASEERTLFTGAFYGSRDLFQLVAARVTSCWTFYGAAVQLGTRTIAIVGRSGIGKTCLVLALMARGARLHSDECVFIDKLNGSVDGLRRALMIREPALRLLAWIPGVVRACRQAPFHPTPAGRLWYAIEPAEIFGADLDAQPSPLSDVVVLDEDRTSSPAVSRIASSIAAAELARRCHVKPSGIRALAELSQRLSNVQCHRLRLGPPDSTADLVCERCTDG
jgi:hypothetical protein